MGFLPDNYLKVKTYNNQEIDWSKYKFRASSYGKILHLDPDCQLTEKQEEELQELEQRQAGLLKGKNGKPLPLTDTMRDKLDKLLEKKNAPLQLSSGAKSYLIALYDKEVYGIDYSFGLQTPSMQKGTSEEEKSIKLYNDVYGTTYIKYEGEELENEWATGNPDILTKALVKDIKSKFTKDTFNKANNEKEQWDWEWQVKCYMWLARVSKGSLVRTLVNTPEHIIESEIEKKCNALGVDPENDPEYYEAVRQQVYRNHTFHHIPKERRIKELDIQLTLEDIEHMILCAGLAREYLQGLKI
jgi:hypothetical protein